MTGLCRRWLRALPLIALPFSHPGVQAQESPCFFCHMDVTAEYSTSRHANLKVSCEGCHGVSIEHMDVEDNSVKPDRIFTHLDIHRLCKECHQESTVAYEKSAHARLLLSGNKTANTPSCLTCHGSHRLMKTDEIQVSCLKCHTPLPKTCTSEPSHDDHGSALSCQRCHAKHSSQTR